GPLTIRHNITTTGVSVPNTHSGDLQLNVCDTSKKGDDLTVLAGVKLESTGAAVRLLVGDNITIEHTPDTPDPNARAIKAHTTIEIQADTGGSAVDPGVGSVVKLAGTMEVTNPVGTPITLLTNVDPDDIRISDKADQDLASGSPNNGRLLGTLRSVLN